MTAPTARSRLRDRLAHLRDDDAGMSTAEYSAERQTYRRASL